MPPSLKRIASEVELIEVPRDRIKRQVFFLEQSLSIAKNISPGNSYNNETAIETAFQQILKDKVKYEDVNNLNLEVEKVLPTPDNNVLQIAKRFVNSIIKFEYGSYLLITSFDLFWHNQPYHDDCANSLEVDDFNTKPVCKIRRKTFKNKVFKVSIFFGIYELLAIGGYFYSQSSSIVPFLGSSIGGIGTAAVESQVIFVPTEQQPYTNTERLLNQYSKNTSMKLWSYHCFRSFVANFVPICPVHFANHGSQKHKSTSIHHFASNLLLVLCCKNQITTDTVSDLWRFFLCTSFLVNNNMQARTFQETKVILSNVNGHVYVKFLVDAASKMERSCPVYALSIFRDEIDSLALSIMTSGLKDLIKKQNEANVLKRIKDSRL